MSNCKVIALTNQKGGVGKTTTAVNLGVSLAQQGKKVLLIDADAQANLTMSLGYHRPDDLPVTLSTIMQDIIDDKSVDVSKSILHHGEGVDLLPSNIELSGLEVRLINAISRESVLKTCVNEVKKNYDYVLVDCMPSLGMLTINALAVADSVVIPTQPHYLSAKGLELLLRSVSTDPAKLESITRNVQLLQSIDWKTHFIRTNDFQYSKIADQLSSLGDLVKILLVLVSVVSTAFLTLLLTMRMRGRMQEAGILLATGVSKGQIMAGFLLEVLAVTIIALILSYVVSFGVTDFLGHSLFGELQPNLLNDDALTAGMNGGIKIENYLKLSAVETLLIYLCQLVVIAASTFVSSIMIMRLKPKEILSKMS